MEIREARPDDLPAITAIYNHAVVNTVATFDLEPFEPEDRRDWFAQFDGEHPIIVAEADGVVVGYAYYLPYRLKPAYARTKELTIYLAPESQGEGVGSTLYAELIERARRAGVHALLGVLGGENAASEALHRKFGFELVGHNREVGRKFGRWVDTYYFQKVIDDGTKSDE